MKDYSATASNSLFLLEEDELKALEQLDEDKWALSAYDPQSLKYEDLTSIRSKYPLVSVCRILVLEQEASFHKAMLEEYRRVKGRVFSLEVHSEWKKLQPERKHERVLSEKLSLKHNKNISTFSNVSAISKVEHQSVLSSAQSDLFESNELSLNITLNQNSSILMMGGLSDCDKEEEKQKENDKQEPGHIGHHRIYSIREENSHTSANNLSTSTENSVRKRNRKWPIPYLQTFRVAKHEKGGKYRAEVYLRELAEKGILMIRREKAEDYLLESEVSRGFVRNIGEKEIEYVAYIIDFLSVECLAWVI